MTDQEFNRRMVRTVWTVAGTVAIVAALWAARDALMLIYVSGLIAMGFSPLVRLIERPKAGHLRIPRTLAILTIYLAIIGVIVVVGLLVVPTLVDQAAALWERLPQYFSDFQRVLIPYRLMARRVTLEEAVQNAPAGSGGSAVTTVLSALWSVTGGVLGIITIIILSFYLLIEAESLMQYATRFVPARQRAHVVA